MTFSFMLKRPTAFLPMAMSVAALLLVLVSIGLGGAARESDEGTVAHLWQLLIAGQLPLIGFFAVAWLPRAPRVAVAILVLQALAFVAALAPVYVFHL